MKTPVFLGIDIGTSGIRGSCIDSQGNELLSHRLALESTTDPAYWLTQLDCLLLEISDRLEQCSHPKSICAIAIDGTSGTLIACDKDGTPLAPALMYNDQQAQAQAEIISRFAPADSAVHGASSSLAKALLLLEKFPATERLCHQADWLAASLSGRYDISDENNCLKLGYDSRTQQWPDWLQENAENVGIDRHLLPQVLAPGETVAPVLAKKTEKYRLAENCIVVAGTTDSNAAVLATGACETGDAVTSLGSTLVIKLFSDKPLFNPEYGIYSHHLNRRWLVGGASNSGGAVLLKYFSRQQIDEMTPQLQPDQPTGLHYYPLPATGERFPFNDSSKQDISTPRPASDVEFFQALLEGMAGIEAQAYKKLEALGAATPQRIFTAGGGSKNTAWTKIRQRITGLPVIQAQHSEASYGSALLALKAVKNEK